MITDERGGLDPDKLAGDEPRLDAVDAKLMRASVAARLFPRNSEPTKIAHYVIEQRIGQGAMGIVYRAHDVDLDRRVAIKLLRHANGDRRREARLLREAQALARISHPNVIQIYQVGHHGDQIYIAMEYLEGVSLRERKYDSITEVLQDFVSAGRGLAAAHRAGLVHRDFKPDNVLVGNDGRVCVLDFGLARSELAGDVAYAVPSPVADGQSLDSQSLDASPTLGSGSGGLYSSGQALNTPMTRTGACLGTPAYMAPEQYSGTRVDARSDQFSFCVALWEKLVDERPFRGNTAGALQVAIQEGPAEVEVADLPRRLRGALVRGLAVDPADRYPNMEALLSQLEPRKAQRPWFAVVSGAAAAAVAGLLAFGISVDDPCAAAVAPLHDSWNESVRSQLSEHFATRETAFAVEVWRSTESALDEFSRSWASVSERSCQDAMVERSLSPEAHGRRLLCLGRRLSELQAVTQLLGEADERSMTRAATMAGRLESPVTCVDDTTLAALPAQSAQRRTAGLEIDAGLGRAWGQKELGRNDEAMRTADAALGKSRELGDRAREGRAELLRGEIEMRLRKDFEAAASTLERAIDISGRAGDLRTRLQAQIWLVRVLGYRLQKFQRVDVLVAEIEAQLDVMGDEPELRARLHIQLGSTDFARGKFDSAMEHHRRALALRTELLGPDHIEVGVALNNMGNALVSVGRVKEARQALARALKILGHELGPRHPWLPIIATNLANSTVAVAGTTQNEDERAQLLASAEVAYRSVVQGRRQQGQNQGVSIGDGLRALANVRLQQGDAEESLALYREAERTYQRSSGVAPHLSGITGTGIGHCLSDLGRHAEAIVALEAALDVFERHGEGGSAIDRAEASLALARSLQATRAGAELCRARRLAKQAETLYAGLPGEVLHRELADARSWLVAHAAGHCR